MIATSRLARCPDCGSDHALSMLGSRASSLLSVAVSHVFLTEYNDDKKLIAFTDSVQDASHRAGFFGAHRRSDGDERRIFPCSDVIGWRNSDLLCQGSENLGGWRVVELDLWDGACQKSITGPEWLFLWGDGTRRQGSQCKAIHRSGLPTFLGSSRERFDGWPGVSPVDFENHRHTEHERSGGRQPPRPRPGNDRFRSTSEEGIDDRVEFRGDGFCIGERGDRLLNLTQRLKLSLQCGFRAQPCLESFDLVRIEVAVEIAAQQLVEMIIQHHSTMSFNVWRARARRERTVPIGTSSASAISW